MAGTFHIFIIHTESLTQRALRLHGTIQALRLRAQAAGYVVKPFFVLNPTSAEITSRQESYQSRINYDPIDVPELDHTRKMLTVEILSNMEKHAKAWNMITNMKNDTAGDLYMVIEDDMVMLDMHLENFSSLLKLFKTEKNTQTWDILFTGLSSPHDKTLEIEDTRKNTKVLMSKEAYFIQKPFAKRLEAECLTKIKYPLRQQLSWYMLTHIDAHFCNTTQQITVDGSKLGLTPTTLHESNYLISNAEFTQFVKYYSSTEEEIKKNMKEIHKLYDSIKHLASPYITHIYVLILHKAGIRDNLVPMMLSAIDGLHEQQGLLNSRTEMLNHFIDICKDVQTDLSLLNAKSKYLGMSSAE
jgi:GR25 family glycosyltransferase involved in LPS biosynthesis